MDVFNIYTRQTLYLSLPNHDVAHAMSPASSTKSRPQYSCMVSEQHVPVSRLDDGDDGGDDDDVHHQ